jgi:hypothetical protein
MSFSNLSSTCRLPRNPGIVIAVGLAFAILACDAQAPTEPTTPSASRAPALVEVCHAAADASWLLLRLPEEAAAAHLERHADGRPGDLVPGNPSLVFTADCSTAQAEILAPVLISPAQGALVDNGCSQHQDIMRWEFTWIPVPGGTEYRLFVMHPGAVIPVYDGPASDTGHVVESYAYVTDTNRFGWEWHASAVVDGERRMSEVRTFDIEPLNTDCPGSNP